MGQIFSLFIIIKSVYVVSFMLSFRDSFQRSANSSMLSPLLILTASNGIILCWCAGALAAAAGCKGEFITLSTGRWVPGRMRSRSSSYVKSRGSVLGAYGLKSRIWPFERSRVRRKSKISRGGNPTLVSVSKKDWKNVKRISLQSSLKVHFAKILVRQKSCMAVETFVWVFGLFQNS